MKNSRQCLLIISILFLSGCNTADRTSDVRSTQMPRDTTWKQLSLREKIGQTMLMKYNPEEEMRVGEGSYKTYFEKYPVGGFFLANWIISQKAPPDSMALFIKDLVRRYTENSKLPLFIQEDFEYGLGGAIPELTKMPYLMAVGAANDTTLAYNYGKSIGREARSLGINWLLNPVADLSMNPFNALVSTRSISDDPDLAIKLLPEVIEGAREAGIASTIKHFPGDGVDYRDQHMLTTENNLTREAWWKTYGKVFQELIRSGISAVMLGHIRLPAFQTDSIDGTLPPATLSRQIATGLLKEKMGFKGVVISDALEMGGFQKYYPTRISSQIACFEAGCDVLLWPDLAYMDSLEARILRNEIPLSRLNDAVSRVWALKEKLGLLDGESRIFQPLSPAEKAFSAATAKAIAGKSITLVANKRNSLPMGPGEGKKILFQIVAPPDTRDYALHNFSTTFRALEALGYAVDTAFSSETNPPLSYSDQYYRMIFAFMRYPRPMATQLLSGEEAWYAWVISSLPPEKVVIVSYGDPYIHSRYFERIGTCVNAYSDSPATQLAVVQALAGQIPFAGKSPVTLYDPGRSAVLHKLRINN